ncbi:uncharacterized protein LOC113290060 isoform X3 [Papaver somniferum]|uniref:uncharacterized protein LOC113290060 isoform X3 n=1 Tax=Papaver somniferum TaxID=3469 RepID=UPI000E6F8C37|nr:uncharacterized protein LOC113290060 isoform X3 [Papaver somniferum]
MYIYKMASVEKKNRFRFAVSVEKKKTHGLAKDITKGKQDWTFLLCYPISVASKRIVGKILTAIEGIGLDIMGMRLMCASAKFLTTHFDRDGRNPCPGDSMLHLTRYPFIAMILVGEDAIEKAHQLTSEKYQSYFTCEKVLQLTSEISVTKTLNIWAPGRLKAYTSDSFRSAVKDYELWFASDSLFTWRKEVEASKYLACAFPDGTLSGPTDDVRENLVKSEHYIFPNFPDIYYKEDLTFVLIRPLAFEKQCVGELVSIIERNSFYTKGLKLVRKSEFPDSKAWPASSSGDEKCEFGIGIAMLVRHILPQIQIVNDGDGCICNDGNIGKIKICSTGYLSPYNAVVE